MLFFVLLNHDLNCHFVKVMRENCASPLKEVLFQEILFFSGARLELKSLPLKLGWYVTAIKNCSNKKNWLFKNEH